MKKKWLALPLLVLLSLVWVSTVTAAETKKVTRKTTPTTTPNKVIVTPDDLQWKDGPAAIPNSKMAVLDGDPKKAGFFVMRVKLPAGTKIAPHVHEKVERVTVISGKAYLAMGDKQQNPTVLPAGSYFSLPPGMVHNLWVDEETVVQISTNGPWSMKQMTSKEKKGAE